MSIDTLFVLLKFGDAKAPHHICSGFLRLNEVALCFYVLNADVT